MAQETTIRYVTVGPVPTKYGPHKLDGDFHVIDAPAAGMIPYAKTKTRLGWMKQEDLVAGNTELEARVTEIEERLDALENVDADTFDIVSPLV